MRSILSLLYSKLLKLCLVSQKLRRIRNIAAVEDQFGFFFWKDFMWLIIFFKYGDQIVVLYSNLGQMYIKKKLKDFYIRRLIALSNFKRSRLCNLLKVINFCFQF